MTGTGTETRTEIGSETAAEAGMTIPGGSETKAGSGAEAELGKGEMMTADSKVMSGMQNTAGMSTRSAAPQRIGMTAGTGTLLTDQRALRSTQMTGTTELRPRVV